MVTTNQIKKLNSMLGNEPQKKASSNNQVSLFNELDKMLKPSETTVSNPSSRFNHNFGYQPKKQSTSLTSSRTIPKKTNKKKKDKNTFEKLVDTINSPLKAFDKKVYQPLEKKAHRFAASFVDGETLGQFKKTVSKGNKALDMEAPKFVKEAVKKPKNKTDKVIDKVGEFAGMAAPISTSYKVTSPLIKPLAKVLPEVGKLGVASKIGQTALRGGLGMGAYGTAREGLDEVLHPNDANFAERAKNVRNDVLAGAILDPAFSVGGAAVKKGLEKASNKAMKKMLPTPEEFQKAVADYTKSAKADHALPIQNKSINPEVYKNILENSTEVNPLDRLKVNKQTVKAPQIETVFSKPLKEENLLDRAEVLQGKPRTLPDLSKAKPVIEPPSNVNVYGVEMPKGDPVDTAPPEYWQKRYEDFTKYVKEKGYSENNLSQESINELWSHFAKPNEPSLNAVIDLAYKGYKEPKPIDAADVWDKLGNRPPVSQNAKKILGLDQLGKPGTNGLLDPLSPNVEKPNFTFKNMFEQLSGKPIPEPKVTKESIASSTEPVALKSLKPTKDVNMMSKDELQTMYKQLESQKQALSKGKGKANSQKIKAIKEDMEKIQGLLMRLDLQSFGKKEPAISQQTKSSAQEYAIAQSKQDNLVKEYEKKGKKSEAEIAKMLQHSDNWQDKGKFLLGRETMERNFDEIMGKDAPKFKQKFLDPIKSQEAERIRFLNKERSQVKTYGIKAKSLDDQLVQMYGEKKISLDELKEKTPNWEKVVKVSEAYRNKYDELLDTVNKVLVENGFKEIPKRQDYFPHYEEIDGLMKKLGFDMENNSLPTDISGITDQFKPTKSFFRNAMQRKGDETTFGAVQGFDKYIEGISNVIYHTKNIKQLRALDKVIRNKYAGNTHLENFAAQLTEYTNLLAGKKGKIDRVVEDTFGRGVYNAIETIRRRTGANMIGANLASNLTNFIPLTQSLATTNKKAFVKGVFDTLANVFKNDGFVQESNFLTKRVGSDPLYRNMWDTTIDKSMWLLKTIDSFVSQAVTRGKYNELIAKKIPHDQALKLADEYANKLLAGRAKGDMPTLFNSKTFGTIAQFQLEVNNQISFLFKDIPKDARNKAAMASALGQVFLYSYLFNNLYEKAVGRRPAFDPVGIALQAKKEYTNDNLTNGEATLNLSKNVLNTLPFTSLATGGRIPISAGVPDVWGMMEGRTDMTKELTKPLIYLGLPTGGGQLKKAYEGLTAMNLNPLSPQGSTGVYQNDKLKYPVEDNIPNNIRGPLFGQYAFPEAKEYYGNKRTPLSENQTKAYELLNKSGKGKELYDFLRVQKNKPYDKSKVTRILKDDKLSDAEKINKINQVISGN